MRPRGNGGTVHHVEDMLACAHESDRASCPQRRRFLTQVGALAGVFLANAGSSAQTPTTGLGRIDFHHHFLPPDWAAFLTSRDALTRQRLGWTPAKSIEAMDRAGVATAILSTTQNQEIEPGQDAEADALRPSVRDFNEYGAKLVSDHPGLFATLPLPDIDSSLREMEYALNVLKADGIGVATSYDDKWLGDPALSPVFEELNRRNAVVYAHPTAANCCLDLIPNVPEATIEYGTDTTRAIVSLLVSGAASRYPNVRFVFSHAGGTMPFLIERIIGGRGDLAQVLASPAEPDSRLYHLRRFYYDTAATANPVAMAALRKVVPASQIVFGTDFPYSTMLDILKGLQESGVFSADDLQAIGRENALRLLPNYGV